MSKVLKKICGILGYKLLPKNYIKNKNYLAEFASLNLEKIISNLVEKKIINSLIQIGDDIICFPAEKNILLKIN